MKDTHGRWKSHFVLHWNYIVDVLMSFRHHVNFQLCCLSKVFFFVARSRTHTHTHEHLLIHFQVFCVRLIQEVHTRREKMISFRSILYRPCVSNCMIMSGKSYLFEIFKSRLIWFFSSFSCVYCCCCFLCAFSSIIPVQWICMRFSIGMLCLCLSLTFRELCYELNVTILWNISQFVLCVGFVLPYKSYISWFNYFFVMTLFHLPPRKGQNRQRRRESGGGGGEIEQSELATQKWMDGNYDREQWTANENWVWPNRATITIATIKIDGKSIFVGVQIGRFNRPRSLISRDLCLCDPFPINFSIIVCNIISSSNVCLLSRFFFFFFFFSCLIYLIRYNNSISYTPPIHATFIFAFFYHSI